MPQRLPRLGITFRPINEQWMDKLWKGKGIQIPADRL
jgi:hypothetical protein